MADQKRLFCNFCLRNEFYKLKYLKNTLVMSFRGIIGYYYYCFYSKTHTWINELWAFINLHEKIGLENPLFSYDTETFCWFVDFSKVGNKKGQMPLDYVLETTVAILASLNMYENVKGCSPSTIYGKYRDAIVDFHHHRRRPEGQKILVPTLIGCSIPTTNLNNPTDRAIPVNMLKNFTINSMVEKKFKI